MQDCTPKRNHRMHHKFMFVRRSPEIRDRFLPSIADGMEQVDFFCKRCGTNHTVTRKYANPALPGSQWQDKFG
jgi:hypothetical protein